MTKEYGIKLGGRGTIKLRRGKTPAVGQGAPQDGFVPVEDDDLITGRLFKKGTITLYDLGIRMIAGIETPINQRYVYAAYNSTPTLPDVYHDLDEELLAGDYTQSRPLDFVFPDPALPNGIVIVHVDASTDTFMFTEADGWRDKGDGSGFFRAVRSIAGIYTHEGDYYADMRLAMDPAVVKITALPDYTASAIPLAPIKKSSRVQVYLAPHRPKFRLDYKLEFSNPSGPVNSGIGVGGPFNIQLPIIDRWPVRPTMNNWNGAPMGELVIDAEESYWDDMYAAPEAAALAAIQAASSDPTIFISGRVDGKISQFQETVYIGTFMGIIVIDGAAHYVWSSVFDNKGEFHLGSVVLPRTTTWGVEPLA